MEERTEKPEIFSKKVKAGKRTYFFDIKPTKSGDFYLTITESKKRLIDEVVVYEKHKIFLYKEDIQKFNTALGETFLFFKDNLMPHYDFNRESDMNRELEEADRPSFKY